MECRSVLVKLHPITVYRTVFGSVRFLCWMPLVVFFGFTNIVSCSMINRLIPGCLWPLVFVLNNILTPDILYSAISHLPGCFCPWTFFKNIGFNIISSDPFMSHLATKLGYSTGEFQALQPSILVTLVSWMNHLPPVCWSPFWKSSFKQELCCRFDIMDCTSSFYRILTYATLYVLIHHMIFRLYLYILDNVLCFYQVPLY